MEIAVTYRRTSRLSVRIGKRGEVRVSAPYGVSDAALRQFVELHREWITRAQVRMLERQAKRAAFFAQLPLHTAVERREAVERMQRLILPWVQHYAALMGVRPTGVGYRAMVSRWGCCHTQTHQLQFSLYLLLLPDWCVEHVVVHELAHLLVPNHSAKFYAVMNHYFPRWREARQATRRLSCLEEE